MAFDIPRGAVFSVDDVNVQLDAGCHPFEVENTTAIARNWDAEFAANPALFDGELVLLSALRFAGGTLAGRCHKIRFSTFLYWRKNRAIGSAEHCFAHAALVSSDGALIAARMGPHTANAGRVYFAAGSFEPGDFRDGSVDLHSNMAREVAEETGLDIANLRRDAGYHVYSGNGGTVIFRRYHLDQKADEIAERIRAFVAAEEDPEIAGPVVIRDSSDLPHDLMPHMGPIINWHFEQQITG